MSRLFIVSGPSGAGKSSLCKALLEKQSQLKLAISCTTRSPRPGEVDGREYHFLDMTTFEALRDQDAFLEWAKVHDNYYATRQADVEAVLAKGDDVLLEIDWQGAAQVAKKMPNAERIFVLPPSIEALRERLIERGQDGLETIEKRVAAASSEMQHADEAQHQLVNDDFNQSLATLMKLFG